MAVPVTLVLIREGPAAGPGGPGRRLNGAMADLSVRDGVLRVRFTRPEKFWGLIHDLDVPLTKVTKVAEVRQWREVRGFRVGSALPRVWLAGRWYWRHSRQLVALRRGRPAVHLWLRGAAYDEVLVSTDDPAAVIAMLDVREPTA